MTDELEHIPLDEELPIAAYTTSDLRSFFKSMMREDEGDAWEVQQLKAYLGTPFEKTFFYVDIFNKMSYVTFMEENFGARWCDTSWSYDESETGDMGFYKNDKGDDIEYLADGYLNLTYKGTPFVFRFRFDHEVGACVCMFYTADNQLKRIQPLMEKMKSYCDSLEYFKGKSCYFQSGALRVLKSRNKIGFEDVILDDDLKAEILKNTQYYLENAEKMQLAGIEVRRGVILSGYPGNGKSLLCKALETNSPPDVTVIWVTAGSVSRINQIETLFDAAEKLGPCLIIIEDIDSMVGNRELDGGSALLGEFLTQMDGINAASGIVTVATTNYINNIDNALKNRPKRFDRHYEIPLPNAVQRKRLFELEKTNHKCGVIKEETVAEIVKKSDKFSAVFYSELFHTATVNKLRRGGKSISDEDMKLSIDEVITAKKAKAVGGQSDYV